MFGNDSPGTGRFMLLLGCLFAAYTLWSAPAILMPTESADWTPGLGAPRAAGLVAGQVFDCPFPAGTERHFWDFAASMDLSAADGVELVYTCESPTAFKSVTWYMRSGDGWFATALPVGSGRRRCWIPLPDFEHLGKVAGWERVTGARLSPWSSGRGSGRFVLHTARASRAAIAIARPGELTSPGAGARAFGARAADWLGTQLSRMSLPYAMLDDTQVSSDATLNRYEVLVLPCHPHLPPPILKNLRSFTAAGGRLMVCYNGDEKLGAMVGVGIGEYIEAKQPGRWYSMCFPPSPEWPGPPSVSQSGTPNIITASPASRDTKTLAWWCDVRGRRQSEVACLASPRGIWFTHVLSDDDEAAQRQMLAALLDRLLAGSFATAARQFALEVMESGVAGVPAGVQSVEAGILTELFDKTHTALSNGTPATVWNAAERLESALGHQLAASLPELFSGVVRGVWVGDQMLAEDWNRMAGELAGAGLTDVFLRMPRAAAPPASVIAACARNALRAHLWHICWNLDGMPVSDLRRLADAGRLQMSAAGVRADWLCPSQPVNRVMELERLSELADVAGVAGVHLDYVRYPDEQHCYCPACKKEFEALIGEPVEPWPEKVRSGTLAERYRDWRARQISEFVAEFSRQTRLRHPGHKLSAAVFPLYLSAREKEGQDWGHWLREDWLDFVCPMNYTENLDEFAAWVAAQTVLPGATGRIVVGIGAASAQSRLTPAQILRQMRVAADAADGYVVFALNRFLRRQLLPVLRQARRPGVPAVQKRRSDDGSAVD